MTSVVVDQEGTSLTTPCEWRRSTCYCEECSKSVEAILSREDESHMFCSRCGGDQMSVDPSKGREKAESSSPVSQPSQPSQPARPSQTTRHQAVRERARRRRRPVPGRRIHMPANASPAPFSGIGDLIQSMFGIPSGEVDGFAQNPGDYVTSNAALQALMGRLMHFGNAQNRRASEEFIKNLPVVTDHDSVAGNHDDSIMSCPICMMDLFEQVSDQDAAAKEKSANSAENRSPKASTTKGRKPLRWECTSCTFLNKSVLEECQMCETQRSVNCAMRMSSGDELEEDAKDDDVDTHCITRLGCNHLFHRACIVPWLQNNVTCPVCRTEIPSESIVVNDSNNAGNQ